MRGASLTNKVLLCVGLVLTVTGCMTQYARLPGSASSPAVAAASDAPLIGLAQVRDSRSDDGAGMIGALGIRVGPDLIAYVQSAIKLRLRDQGFKPVDAPNPNELGANLSTVFNRKVLLVTVQSASISTESPLFIPADSSVTLLAEVYGSTGDLIYVRYYTKWSRKRLGLAGSSAKKQGEVIAAAVDATLDSMFADSDFLEALR